MISPWMYTYMQGWIPLVLIVVTIIVMKGVFKAERPIIGVTAFAVLIVSGGVSNYLQSRMIGVFVVHACDKWDEGYVYPGWEDSEQLAEIISRVENEGMTQAVIQNRSSKTLQIIENRYFSDYYSQADIEAANKDMSPLDILISPGTDHLLKDRPQTVVLFKPAPAEIKSEGYTTVPSFYVVTCAGAS